MTERVERARRLGEILMAERSLAVREKRLMADLEEVRGDEKSLEGEIRRVKERLMALREERVEVVRGVVEEEAAMAEGPRERFGVDTCLKGVGARLAAEFIEGYLEVKGAPGLKGIGEAMVAAAAKYGIRGAYILGHAIHESGWGRSRIAKEKNNLFGWAADDAAPFSRAGSFESKAMCIDFVMGRVDELYLTEGGRFFRGAACLGRGGAAAYGMNAKYARDPEWGAKIAAIAEAIEVASVRWVAGQAPEE